MTPSPVAAALASRIGVVARSAFRIAVPPGECERVGMNFDRQASIGLNDFNFDSIYTDNLFSGVDRVSDLHAVSVGATSRWVSGLVPTIFVLARPSDANDAASKPTGC